MFATTSTAVVKKAARRGKWVSWGRNLAALSNIF